MQKDLITLDSEKSSGKKILKKVFDKGSRIYQEKTLSFKRKLFFEKIACLPEKLRCFDTETKYPVEISKNILALTEKLAEDIKRRIQVKQIFIDVDCQTDFLCKSGALFVKGSERTAVNASKLTSFAKKNNILIVSTQDTHSKNDPEFREFPPHCLKGTKGCKKIRGTLLRNSKTLTLKKKYTIDELKKTAEKFDQLIIEKPTYSAFANPNLKPLLEAVFPDRVYVYGVVTEFCVKEVVEGLLKQSYSVFLVIDAVKEISSQEKDELYDSWQKKGVQFIKTADILSNKI